MAERNVNALQPSRVRAASAACRQASLVTRIQRSLPSRMWAPTSESPSASFIDSRSPTRSSSSDSGEVGSAGAAGSAGSSPGWSVEGTAAPEPSAVCSAWPSASAASWVAWTCWSVTSSSAILSSGATPSPSADDNGFTLPALSHVLVLDALLQQHDALEQRLGPGRAAGHVDVDRDDLVHALGHRIAVPVGAAAVRA